jgi:FkbM family methyltransferase
MSEFLRRSRFSQLRARMDESFLRLVRSYTYNTPVQFARHRTYLTALKLCRFLPSSSIVSTHDGRMFDADLTTGMQTTLFFLGEYEKAITNLVIDLLQNEIVNTRRPAPVFLDVGANFGWYTTLFQKYAGTNGQVHSFEPVPSIFSSLTKNYELMGSPENVFINNLALGDKVGEITVNLFEGLSTGHASISTQNRDDAISFKCQMTTFDSYLDKHKITHVDFVKVDIEGAEMMFLTGAEKLFMQDVPPIWLMEMALNQTKNFGYRPNDLIEFIRARADYDFYKIDEIEGRMIEINAFADDDIGANVICIPKSRAT